VDGKYEDENEVDGKYEDESPAYDVEGKYDDAVGK
jgi:hypothetical protein